MISKRWYHILQNLPTYPLLSTSSFPKPADLPFGWYHFWTPPNPYPAFNSSIINIIMRTFALIKPLPVHSGGCQTTWHPALQPNISLMNWLEIIDWLWRINFSFQTSWHLVNYWCGVPSQSILIYVACISKTQISDNT